MGLDQERRDLERLAASGEPAAIRKLETARFLTLEDAEYLMAYLRLCDEVSREPHLETALQAKREEESEPYATQPYEPTAPNEDDTSREARRQRQADYWDRIERTYRRRSLMRPRSRPVEEVEADLKRLNDAFEGRVSSGTLRKSLLTLGAFREGVGVGAWSSSDRSCIPSLDYGGDVNVMGYIGDAAPYKWRQERERNG